MFRIFRIISHFQIWKRGLTSESFAVSRLFRIFQKTQFPVSQFNSVDVADGKGKGAGFLSLVPDLPGQTILSILST